jgi:hypothetical protein
MRKAEEESGSRVLPATTTTSRAPILAPQTVNILRTQDTRCRWRALAVPDDDHPARVR